tara:strand:+ start:594 stop:1532 length:939 start_codon:yes stop_codon:yes gene_type:complete
MKLSTLRENIGSEVKLSKSGNRFIKGCRFYIEAANFPDIRLKVVGPTATTFSHIQSRSIVSLIITVVEKKAPSIKTMKGKSFSNEFKVLCSLMYSSASIGSGYVDMNNKEISTLTEAGFLKEIHGEIQTSVTGKALVKKRLASIIKSGKTLSLRDNIVKVVRHHNTAIELEILKTGETLRSNIEEFPSSAITVKYTKPVVKIKEGDIVRIKKCTDARRYVGKTAKVAQYRADTSRQNTELIVDGVYWWVNYTDIEFVKTPAIKAELIAEKKKETARAKRLKAYKSQVAKVLELQNQLSKEIDKRRKLYRSIL